LSKQRYNENTLQRNIVEHLNTRSNLGCAVSRIKNGGTYDPIRKIFRSNNTEKGIPDIMGCTKDGIAVFIEVKMANGKLSPEQTEYLIERSKRGAIVGVAYDIGDAFDIVVNDPINYPRKDRTFGNKKLRAILAQDEASAKKQRKSRDPLAFLYALHADSTRRAEESRASAKDDE
jgi:VRR-NUC domain.